MRRITIFFVMLLPTALSAECSGIELSLNLQYADISILIEKNVFITYDGVPIERSGVVEATQCTLDNLTKCDVNYSFEIAFLNKTPIEENILIGYCSTVIKTSQPTDYVIIGVGEANIINLNTDGKYNLYCSGGGILGIAVANKSLNTEASKAGSG